MSEKKIKNQRIYDKIVDMLSRGKNIDAYAYIERIGGRERLSKVNRFLADQLYS